MVAGRRAAWRATTRVRADEVYASVPNKANFPFLWAENAGWAEKQTQSKPIQPVPHGPSRSKPTNPKSEARNPRQTPNPNDPNGQNAPNKTAASKVGILRFHPQYRRQNAGCWRVSGLLACAPNKANLRSFWAENWVRAKKQSQFMGRRSHGFSPLCGRPVPRRNVRPSPLTQARSRLMMARSERNLEPGFPLDWPLVSPKTRDQPCPRECYE